MCNSICLQWLASRAADIILQSKNIAFEDIPKTTDKFCLTYIDKVGEQMITFTVVL